MLVNGLRWGQFGLGDSLAHQKDDLTARPLGSPSHSHLNLVAFLIMCALSICFYSSLVYSCP
jgi:hypothetical protein